MKGEPGLANWRIYAEPERQQRLRHRRAFGRDRCQRQLQHRGLTPGSYTFREVLKTGWTCSYPANCKWVVTLTSHQVDTGNDFGNWTPPRRKARSFEDLNANGVQGLRLRSDC